MMDIKVTNILIRIRDRAGQITSATGAVSDAVTYAPNDPGEYKGALELITTLMQQLTDDLTDVVNG
ncbi:MAG: hypothetical protein KH230_21560 [Enterocloster asparagiformis]|nr:hypothetical protein [Enterocloster asparagiformis]